MATHRDPERPEELREVSGHCFTTFAGMKWAQIVFGLTNFGLTDWGRFLWILVKLLKDSYKGKDIDKLLIEPLTYTGYKFVMVAMIALAIVTFISLLLYVCRHRTPSLMHLPWSKIETGFNVIAALTYGVILILSGIEASKLLNINLDKFHFHNKNMQRSFTPGVDRWTGHVVLSGLNMLLYVLSAVYAQCWTV